MHKQFRGWLQIFFWQDSMQTIVIQGVMGKAHDLMLLCTALSLPVQTYVIWITSKETDLTMA
jgi:hypothetical protein